MKSMKWEPGQSKFLWSEFHQTLGQSRMSEQGREKFGRPRTSYLLSSPLFLSLFCVYGPRANKKNQTNPLRCNKG